jgi:6-phosphogluconolactonase
MSSRSLSAAFATVAVLSVGAPSPDARAAGAHRDLGGFIYAMTNSPDGNEVLVFARGPHGKIWQLPKSARSTGGLGAGENAPVDALGSQGSLIYDANLDRLFAVNAGDDTVASLDASEGAWLRLDNVVDSGGEIPVSLAVSDGVLYVLNAGGAGAVATFAVEDDGSLTLLDTLDLGLPASATSVPFDVMMTPGQVGVDKLHRRLIVVDKAGNALLHADLGDDGVPSHTLVETPTPGVAPFAFAANAFGSLLVAEAMSGSVSAFDPPLSATPLTPTASAVPTGQMATCWIVAHDAGYAYVSNTASNTLSSYRFTRTGDLALVDATAGAAGMGPIDLTLAGGGRFLYSLNAGSGTISVFKIDFETGGLTLLENQPGLPAGAGIQGIAARN